MKLYGKKESKRKKKKTFFKCYLFKNLANKNWLKLLLKFVEK